MSIKIFEIPKNSHERFRFLVRQGPRGAVFELVTMAKNARGEFTPTPNRFSFGEKHTDAVRSLFDLGTKEGGN